MTTIPSNIEQLVSDTSDLGNALKTLFQNGVNGGPSTIHITELLEIAQSMNLDSVIGALKILFILGIIEVDNNGVVRIRGKYSRFALGSLSDFLSRSLPVASQPDVDADEERYMTQFTNALEIVRRDKIGMSPQYSVEIVNVIIKGKQIRNFKEKEVYLHYYHPKWKAYHLIGLGKRTEATTGELAHKAMEVKLNLQPHQYSFDPSLNPEPTSYIGISKSHGAITKYLINAKIVRSFSFNLNSHIKNLINDPLNGIHDSTFKWFTKEEIEEGISENLDEIMPSTPILISKLDLNIIKGAAGKVDHLGKHISIWKYFRNRIKIKTAIIFVALTIFFLIIPFFTEELIALFVDKNIPVLENFSNSFQIISNIAALISSLIGYKKST